MRRSALLLTSVLAVFGLAACKEVRIENGEIPTEYRAMAERYMGTYSGVMEQVPGGLNLSLVGNQVVARYANKAGRDILDPRCDSRIGQLVSVTVDQSSAGQYVLTGAKFAFHPNYCWPSVKGRELVLNFKEVGAAVRVEASILLDQSLNKGCHIDPGNPSAGVPPREVCNQQPVSRYAKGRFQK